MVTSGNRYASRLNSFAIGYIGGKPSVLDLARRAATVKGITHLDLNFPDHLEQSSKDIARQISDLGLQINGFAMRYYSNPEFKLGAFTNPDRAIRRQAIDMTKRGIDSARAAGANMMTLWLGQDGFDYPFQVDYSRLWDDEVTAIREVAAHDLNCKLSIEYKPNEPRSFSVLPDCATTILAIEEVGAENLGMTLDFAHVLYAGEQPAFAAAMASKRTTLHGIHLNDGYSKRDDGLIVGSVHYMQTLELLMQITKDKYDGVIYFDTFPDATGLSPEMECAENIAVVEQMYAQLKLIQGDGRLDDARLRHDAVSSLGLLRSYIYK